MFEKRSTFSQLDTIKETTFGNRKIETILKLCRLAMLLTLIRIDKPYQSQRISLYQDLLVSTVLLFWRFEKIESDFLQL